MKSKSLLILSKRIRFLLIIFIVCLVVLSARFFSLQIIDGRLLKDQREKNINTFEYIYPKRGRIISSDNKVLVEDEKIFSVVVNLEQKPSLESIELLSRIFKDQLAIEEIELTVKKSIASGNQEVLLDKISQEDLSKFLVRNSELNGFSILESYRRVYDSHPSIFHVLGHLGYINESDKRYFNERIDSYNSKLWQKVGKSGLERVYENELTGIHGKRYFQRNARGTKKILTKEDEFIEGADLYVSINYEAQKFAYDILAGRQGAIVVIDLNDFSIPVAVSAPSISANDLSGISSSRYAELLKDKSRPLFNRAFMGLYPPGSTIKPLLSIYSLDQNLTNWEETIIDDGFFRIDEQRVFNAWKEGGHGITDLDKALVESSNPFFMNLATRFDKESLESFFSSASFGRKLCTDCYPHQFSPLINDAWKQKNFGRNLFKGDLINVGIGQGYLQITPLHLSLISAMVARRGEYKTPFLSDSSSQEDFSLSQNLEFSDWEKINQSLIGVIYSPSGTAYRVNAGKLKLAGKSGTSQIVDIKSREEYESIRENPSLRDHAVFIGYAPYDNPRYAISVVIENGEGGGSVAGPVARDVLEVLLK